VAVILGVNAVFHDPAAAVIVDGRIMGAAEEERFSRRKHGKQAVPFSTWEVPERSAAWCLEHAGLRPADVDVVTYSYDPVLAPPSTAPVDADAWEPLRTRYAEEAGSFLATALPGLHADRLRYVAHHVAHAASAYLAAPYRDSAVLVLDGRGEQATSLVGRSRNGELEVLHTQHLPHSLGLMYEELTEHLGFHRSSDEYKVMAMASYGTPRHLDVLRSLIRTTGDGGFVVEPIDWSSLAPLRHPSAEVREEHADLASSVQHRLEEVILELAWWLHAATGERRLTMAGGVALNCVANSRLHRDGPFDDIWVQPAAGDSGTALGGALWAAQDLGDRPQPLTTAALGRGWSYHELEEQLRAAGQPYERPDDLAAEVARILAADGVVGWFQGRSEYGPRALGHRSLLANPTSPANVQRMNDIKGREQFRPVAPVVPLERAADIFDGPLPSPYMLFTHRVRPGWRERLPAAVHVDGTARAQTVDRADEPLLHDLLLAFEALTGTPVLINTSFNTAGRPMVDQPRDALECFGSSPIDALVLGPFVVRRPLPATLDVADRAAEVLAS
jgi:carbamoyltransferase